MGRDASSWSLWLCLFLAAGSGGALTVACSRAAESDSASAEAVSVAKTWADRLVVRFDRAAADATTLRATANDADLGRDDADIERAIARDYAEALAQTEAALEQLESVINDEVEFRATAARINVTTGQLTTARDKTKTLRDFLVGDFNAAMSRVGIGSNAERRAARDAFRPMIDRLGTDATALKSLVQSWLGVTGGDGGGVIGPVSQQVSLYGAADCSGAEIKTLNALTDCRSLSATAQVKGISIGGTCRSIPTAKLVDACVLFQNAAAPDAVTLFRDSSGRDVLAYAAPNSKCDWADTDATRSGATVGSIRVGSALVSVPTRPLKDACKVYGAASAPNAVGMTSDDAGNSIVAYTSPTATCDWADVPSFNVWGLRSGDRGRDIGDLQSRDACKLYRNAANPEAVGITSDDAGNAVVAFTAPQAICDWADTTLVTSGNGKAWGIRVADRGRDIPDMTLVDACKLMRGAGAPDAVGVSDGSSVRAYTSSATVCDWDGVATLSTISASQLQLPARSLSIASTPFPKACSLFAAANSPTGVLAFSSTGCSTPLAAISPTSDCAILAEAFTGDVVSRQVGAGACENIAPTPFAQFCRNTRGN